MFFTYIDQVLTPGVDLNLTISKTATGLTVLVMPRINGLNDPAQNRLIPLTISASPQELDANFFPTITAPVQKTSGMLTNIEAYERQQAEAESNSKAAKESKDKDAKEAKDKRDKYDAAFKKAEELEQAGKSEEAIAQLGRARLYATEKATKTVDDKIAAIKATLGQGSLFDATATEAKPVVLQQEVHEQVAEPVLVQEAVQISPQVAEPMQIQEISQVQQQLEQPMQTQEIGQVQQQVIQPVQVQQQIAEPAQIQQPQPAVQVTQPYVPVQQQPIQHPSAMQPNLEFGIFAGQPSPQPTHQQVTQQYQQPIQPQPQTTEQRSTIPALYPPQNTEVEWKNDYEDIIDFPQEMRPPVYIPRIQTPSAATI